MQKRTTLLFISDDWAVFMKYVSITAFYFTFKIKMSFKVVSIISFMKLNISSKSTQVLSASCSKSAQVLSALCSKGTYVLFTSCSKHSIRIRNILFVVLSASTITIIYYY